MLHRILAVAFLLGTTAALSAQSNVSFEMFGDTYTSGGGSVVAGDFNNDGKPDLVQCCGSSGLVFREGNGDGTFQAPVTAAAVTGGVNALAAADFNGDGKLDVAGIANLSEQAALYVWYGNGNGTFQSPLVYATTDTPDSVVTGNFFDDGRVDIAVGETNGNIDLFRNEGNGSFVFGKSINLGGGSEAAVYLAAGDLNGNGLSDIAATLNASSVWALWNNGSGNFTQQELSDSYVEPGVSIGRLNGDGQMDIIVDYTCNPTPSGGEGNGPEYQPCAGFDVYYGQGNNQLVKRTVVTDPGIYALGGPFAVDVNGDGYGDLVAAGSLSCYCEFGAFVWQGNADGSFQQTPQEFLSNTNSVGPMALADFNRDGMMDFAMDQGSFGNAEFYINSTSRAACGTYTISPSVTACQPVDNTWSPSPVRVEANSYDTTKVTAMQEYVDGTLKYSEPVTSFNTTFAASLGSHLLVTKAWDASGRSFVADRTVTVYDGTPGPTCPATTDSANICLPSGAASSSPVLILANGNTGTSVPTAAQLYIDGTLVVNNEGYSFGNGNYSGGTSYVQTTQNLSGGTHSLVFKLWGADGNVYTATKTITVN